MRVHLVGVKRVAFTNDRGESVKGYSVSVTYPSYGVEGLRADTYFISDGMAEMGGWYPAVGDDALLDLGVKGKPIGIAPAPAVNAK